MGIQINYEHELTAVIHANRGIYLGDSGHCKFGDCAAVGPRRTWPPLDASFDSLDNSPNSNEAELTKRRIPVVGYIAHDLVQYQNAELGTQVTENNPLCLPAASRP